MCDPASAVAIAGTMASVAQAQANFQAQRKAAGQLFGLNKTLAEEDAVRSYAALQTRQIQEHQKASQAIDEAHQLAVRKASTARAGAAEAGVVGSDVAAVLDEFKQSELNFQTTVIRNRAMLDAQFGAELEGVRAQEQGRILSGLPGAMQRPDLLGVALSGFGKVLEIRSNLNQTTPNG